MTLYLNHMVSLARSLPFNIHCFGEKEGPNLKWNALRHVAHNQLDIVCNRLSVTLEGSLPIDTLDVPFSWIKILFESEVLV